MLLDKHKQLSLQMCRIQAITLDHSKRLWAGRDMRWSVHVYMYMFSFDFCHFLLTFCSFSQFHFVILCISSVKL